jgi:hypothetical protein
MKQLQLQGNAIGANSKGLICLTDLWRTAGSPENQRPSDWITSTECLTLSAFLQDLANAGNSHFGGIVTKKGGSVKTKGTWADWQLAMAYAKYLSPAFHVEVNEAYRQAKAEEADPQLSVNKAIARWRKLGKSDEWIAARTKGIVARNTLTPVLASHGISGPDGYARCTDATYTPLFGGSASLIREKRELPAKANVREHMSRLELAAIELAEMLASQKIEDERLYGDGELQSACLIASRSVAKAVVNCKSEPVLKSAF